MAMLFELPPFYFVTSCLMMIVFEVAKWSILVSLAVVAAGIFLAICATVLVAKAFAWLFGPLFKAGNQKRVLTGGSRNLVIELR